MISPGFFSLYNSQRALLTAQAGLNVINQNISNANTPGYSRQRAEITAANPYAPPNTYQVSAGQMGQGSVVSQILRIRDQFLDTQYQSSNSTLGLASQMKSILSQVEGILSEPTDQGVNTAVQNFFTAASQLSTNPESTAVRSNFIQMATEMVNVFQQQATQLYSLNGNLVGTPGAPGSFSGSQLGLMTDQVNSMLDQIGELNKQIVTVTASGAQPNDLYDKRELLLDNLSKLVDIKVDRFDNGQINVSLAGGSVLAIRASDVLEHLTYTMNPAAAPASFNTPGLLTTTSGDVLNDFNAADGDIQGGQMKAIIDMGQYNAADPTNLNVRNVLSSLNTLFTNIATEVNALQTTGQDLTGTVNGQALFVQGAATPAGDPIQLLSWQINTPFQDAVNGPKLIAAAANDASAGPGDNRNALLLAALKNKSIGALGNAKFTDYLNSTVSNVGISAQTYSDRAASQTTVLNTLTAQREATSGVNTDEETIDMMRFQRMFEASSKMVSIFDQVYQTIINMV